ncbi:MAG: type II secretion system F family protein [Promethearchaeota archaeon]
MINSKRFYIKFCKIFNKISVFKKIGNFLVSEKLKKSTKYFKDYNLTPEEIATTSIGLLVIFSLAGLILSFLIKAILLIPVIILSSLFSFYFFYYFLIRKFESISIELSKYADLISEDFIFALKSSGSVIEAIKFIANSEYPIISKDFSKMVDLINNGSNPIQLINDYLESQPSVTLKNNIVQLIYNQELDERLEDIIGEESQLFLRNEYERATSILESKVLLITVISIFLPLIMCFFLIFNGYGDTPLFLLVVPFDGLIGYLLKKKLTNLKNQIIGG